MKHLLTYSLGAILLVLGLATTVFSQTTEAIKPDTNNIIYQTMSPDSNQLVLDSVHHHDRELFDILSDTSKTSEADSSVYTLMGFYFWNKDTILVQNWQYNTEIRELEIHPYDSTLDLLHIFNPIFKKAYSSTYLGSSGLASKSNLHFENQNPMGLFFFEGYQSYMNNAKKADYYNVKRPFTIFNVEIGPKDEQNLEVIHTQNVNKHINGFVKYNTFTGKGSYFNQGVRNNALIAGMAIIKGRNASHLNVVFGKVGANENGGITDQRYITDTILGTSEIPTRLQKGYTYMRDRQLFYDQKIGFVKTHKPDSGQIGGYWFSLQYNFFRQKTLKVYTDESDEYYNAATDETLHLYQNNFTGLATFDSLHFTETNNMLRLNLEEVPGKYPFVGLYFGGGIHKMEHYFYNVDTVFVNSNTHYQTNFYLEAGIYRRRNSGFKFEGNYKMYLSGYKQNNFSLTGQMSQRFGRAKDAPFVKAKGELKSETPDYFLNRYYSNHYKWSHNFNPVNTLFIGGEISFPRLKTSAGVNYSAIDNYVFLNEQALPEQESKGISVFDAFLRSKLVLGQFGLITKLDYQATSNANTLPLPQFTGYATLYFEHTFKFALTDGRMRIQMGPDVYYQTAFEAPAYSPALASFHRQSQVMIGNYPFVGAFTNFEIKRLRFFLRFQHINYGISEANYFMAPNYPTPRFQIKYGLSWAFYD